jgi:hypothetical protein
MTKMLLALNKLTPDAKSAERNLQAASREQDPHVRADLEADAKASQRNIANSSAQLLFALVPGTVRQLRSFRGDWNSPDGRNLILNVGYIRVGILQQIPPTPEDQDAAEIFDLHTGGFTNWNADKAASYLEELVKRSKVILPPTITSVEVQ